MVFSKTLPQENTQELTVLTVADTSDGVSIPVSPPKNGDLQGKKTFSKTSVMAFVKSA
jgi:hypothetical protein